MILNIPDEDEFIQELADLFDTPLISEAKYQRVLDLLSGYEMEVKKVEQFCKHGKYLAEVCTACLCESGNSQDFGWVVPKKKME